MLKKFSFLFSMLLMMTILSGNGLSLNNIGTKSIAIGGAYISLAEDATAVYWNPARLSAQKTHLLAFATDIIPMTSYKNDDMNIDTETEMNHYISPNFFANYNLGKFALGFGAFVPSGIGTDWNGEDLLAFNGPAYLDPSQTIPNPYAEKVFEWKSEIAVLDFSPACAYKINDRISLGAALNIYYGMLNLKRPEDMLDVTSNPGTPQSGTDHMMDTQTAFDVTGMGYGATIGLAWECLLLENLNFGLTYRTPSTVEFEGDADIDLQGVGKKDAEMDIEWPTWIGFGSSYKFNEKLTLAFDLHYSDWSSVDTLVAKIKDMPDGQGGTYTRIQKMPQNWEAKTQIRLGASYMLSECLTLRSGYYYDPAPAPDETLNILFPSSTNHVGTMGFSYKFNKKFSMDFASEYLFGAERDVEQAEHNMPGKHQMDILTFSLGLKYCL